MKNTNQFLLPWKTNFYYHEKPTNFYYHENHPYHETHWTKITTHTFLTKYAYATCIYIDCANQNNHTHISYHQNFLITKNGPLCEPTKTHLPCMRTIKNTLTTYARMRTKITNQKLLPRKSKFSRFLKIYRKMSFENVGNLSKINLSWNQIVISQTAKEETSTG